MRIREDQQTAASADADTDAEHTEGHPFCGDPNCELCHNQENYDTFLAPGLKEGTLTGAQALRIYWNQ